MSHTNLNNTMPIKSQDDANMLYIYTVTFILEYIFLGTLHICVSLPLLYLIVHICISYA